MTRDPFLTYRVVVTVKVAVDGIEAHLQRIGAPLTAPQRDEVARRTIQELESVSEQWHASGDSSRDPQPYLMVTSVGDIVERGGGRA